MFRQAVFNSFDMRRIRRLLQRSLRLQPSASLPLERRQLVIGLGAMKSGTSWLSHYLSSHPQFFHSPIKEVNAFARMFPENHLYPDFDYRPETAYTLWRMEKIVLSYGRHPSRLNRFEWERKRFDRLRALAQLGRIETTDDYFDFFRERILDQYHFGEISPSYSHLPATAYSCMAGLCDDVRFLFLMRDPTERAASHLRHLRRRIHRDVDLDCLLERVDSSSPVYLRSDYRYTLETLRGLGLQKCSRFLIYEHLFTQDSLDSLCDWLGMQPHKGAFSQRINPGVGESLTDQQMATLRDRLTPIYDGLRHDPATQGAFSWKW